ncbi:MAG: OmpA family protein [Nevskiales bacterium]
MRALSLFAVLAAGLLSACGYMPKFDMPKFDMPKFMGSEAPPAPLTQTILFDLNSAALKSEEVNALNEFAGQLQCKDGYNIVIEGHADNTGADGHNVVLSEKRSMMVRDVLAANGVATDKIAVAGFGETVPVAPNDQKDGRAQNRRVNVIATQAEGGCGAAPAEPMQTEGHRQGVPKYLYRMGKEGNA